MAPVNSFYGSSPCSQQMASKQPRHVRYDTRTVWHTALWLMTLWITTTRLLIELAACQREVSLLLSRPCYGDEELYNICLLWIDMWIDLTRMASIRSEWIMSCSGWAASIWVPSHQKKEIDTCRSHMSLSPNYTIPCSQQMRKRRSPCSQQMRKRRSPCSQQMRKRRSPCYQLPVIALDPRTLRNHRNVITSADSWIQSAPKIFFGNHLNLLRLRIGSPHRSLFLPPELSVPTPLLLH